MSHHELDRRALSILVSILCWLSPTKDGPGVKMDHTAVWSSTKENISSWTYPYTNFKYTHSQSCNACINDYVCVCWSWNAWLTVTCGGTNFLPTNDGPHFQLDATTAPSVPVMRYGKPKLPYSAFERKRILSCNLLTSLTRQKVQRKKRTRGSCQIGMLQPSILLVLAHTRQWDRPYMTTIIIASHSNDQLTSCSLFVSCLLEISRLLLRCRQVLEVGTNEERKKNNKKQEVWFCDHDGSSLFAVRWVFGIDDIRDSDEDSEDDSSRKTKPRHSLFVDCRFDIQFIYYSYALVSRLVVGALLFDYKSLKPQAFQGRLGSKQLDWIWGNLRAWK